MRPFRRPVERSAAAPERDPAPGRPALQLGPGCRAYEREVVRFASRRELAQLPGPGATSSTRERSAAASGGPLLVRRSWHDRPVRGPSLRSIPFTRSEGDRFLRLGMSYAGVRRAAVIWRSGAARGYPCRASASARARPGRPPQNHSTSCAWPDPLAPRSDERSGSGVHGRSRASTQPAEISLFAEVLPVELARRRP